jgi:DNA polymerase
MRYLTKLYLESIGLESLPANSRLSGSQQPGEGGEEVLPTDGLTLDGLRSELGDCSRCGLASGRKNIVFGAGDPGARVVFVGEAPGRDEDLQGEPFVGKAGHQLTRIIAAMGLARDKVYICNVIKCRPPGNRDPLPAEIAMCQPFLVRQLEIIGPKVICALGSFAARTLLNSDSGISRLRGRFHDFNGIPVMPTYHPSYLLRKPQAKREVWEDIQKVMELLGLPVLPPDGN